MQRFRYSHFSNCLFCGDTLPPQKERKGDGEHVIPKNIFGFWKSHDVCENCMKYFGDNVDNLTYRNLDIINAVNELKLDSKNIFKDGIKYKRKDLFDGMEVNFHSKKGDFHIKTIIENSYLETPEDKLDTVGFNWIKKNNKNNINKDELTSEYKNFLKKFKKANYGTVVDNEKLGFSARKSQAEIIGVDDTSYKPITNLIAKIAICFLYYFVNLKEINKITDLNEIRNHAVRNGKINLHTIYKSDIYKSKNFRKVHIINLDICHNVLVINIALFGYPNYAVILTAKEMFNIFFPNAEGEKCRLKEIKFAMDFEIQDKFRLIYQFDLDNDKSLYCEEYI